MICVNLDPWQYDMILLRRIG